MDNDLAYAVQVNDVAMAQRLLEAGADPSINIWPNVPLLLWAIRMEYTQMAQLLIPYTPISILDLIAAIDREFVEIVHALLEKHPDLVSRNYEGWTPLTYAIHLGNLEIVRTLIQHNANVHREDARGNHPLELALQLEETEIASLLRRHENQVPDVDLFEAIEENDLEAVQQYTKSVNIEGMLQQTPLMDAVEQDQLEMARILLEKGARPNAIVPTNRKSVLMMANAPEMMTLLLQWGANPHYGYKTRDWVEKETVLSWTMKNVRWDNIPLALVEILLQWGADPNATTMDDVEGDLQELRLLDDAVLVLEHAGITRLLLDAGAQPSNFFWATVHANFSDMIQWGEPSRLNMTLVYMVMMTYPIPKQETLGIEDEEDDFDDVFDPHDENEEDNFGNMFDLQEED